MLSSSSFTDKCCKSVGVSDNGWFFDSTRDVVVSVAELVGEVFNLVRRRTDAVVHHSVASWGSHALTSSHRHKIEFVDVLICDLLVADSTRKWVLESTWLTTEQASVNSLRGVDVKELGGIAETKSSKCLLNLVDFSTADTLDLSFTNTISVEDDLSWVSSVNSFESFKSVGHGNTKRVRSFLTDVVLNDRCRPVSGC